MSAIATIEQFVYGAEATFQSVLVDRSINFEREAFRAAWRAYWR